MEIHLDLIGGLAGDMFVAALLDAFPALEGEVRRAIEGFSPLGSTLRCSVIEHNDGLFQGRRFEVHSPAVRARAPLAAAAPAGIS